MQTSGNTILISGGGSGIGRGLAEGFHRLGNKVIITGRRKQTLEETTAANPGMESAVFDIQERENIRPFAEEIARRHPSLNVLVNNAGIMRPEKLKAQPEDLADAEAIIATNLLGPIRLTAALLPYLQEQQHPAIANVSSGLAFVPMALTATYCATKAAIHSYTQSLRHQLRGAVEVIEIIPPYVQTDLMDGANDPRAMPLADYVAETMRLLTAQPTPEEIIVERVKPLRFACDSGKYDQMYKVLNGAWPANE